MRISDWSSCSSDLALLGRTAAAAQVVAGVDQADMRERLREVAELAAEPRVVLLGEQAEVVAQCEQALEQRLGVAPAADHGVGVGRSEERLVGKEGQYV